MNRSAGWGAAILVAVAALFGVAHRETPVAVPQESSPQKEPAVPSPPMLGATVGCEPVEKQLQRFFHIPANTVYAPAYCYGAQPQPSNQARDEWLGTIGSPKFLIALLADPVHTHLALTFDQMTESVEHAAQAEHFTFDSSWMPWRRNEQEYKSLKDNLQSGMDIEAREQQPGIMLFRDQTDGSEPYASGLVVFVVGEKPTAGINKEQFQNAVSWTAALSPNSDPNPLSILGPFSSGSFDSLEQVLYTEIHGSKTPLSKLKIATGTATSSKAIAGFDKDLSRNLEWHRILTLNESTELEIQRYISLLKLEGYNSGQLAVMSEDETVFGNIDNKQTRVVRLNYPRDIASLRSAYQREGLISTRQSRADYAAGQRLLASDLGEQAKQQTNDTIDTYSGPQADLSDESELLQIVSQLENHKIQYVLLISSNPLDQLFLAAFLRNAYPAGQIVIPASNQILLRGRGSESLRGIMTLSPYPLNPEVQNWTTADSSSERHIFTSDAAQGVYYATRVLLQSMRAESPYCNITRTRGTLELPGYRAPFWMSGGADSRIPPSWLSVISAGTTWPVAALDETTLSSLAPSWRGSQPPEKPLLGSPKSLASLLNLGAPADAAGKLQSAQPPEFRIAVILCFFWALMQGYFRWCNSPVRKPRCRAYFSLTLEEEDSFKHALVLNLGWASVGSAAMAMWRFSGNVLLTRSLSTVGDYRVRLVLVLIILGSAVFPIIDRTSHKNEYPEGWRGVVAAWISFLLLAGFGLTMYLALPGWNEATTVSQQWRAMHLFSGVSPIMPFLLVSIGAYLWCFQSSHGAALFNIDKPVLPLSKELTCDVPLPQDDLCVETQSSPPARRRHLLRMFSSSAYLPAEKESLPLERFLGWVTLILVVCYGFLISLLHLQLHDLEGVPYGDVYGILVLVSMTISITETVKLCRVWRCLERLLNHLDRVPLRRAMLGLKDFSWNSVWSMGGAVLDHRYRMVSRQVETFRHLQNTLDKYAFDERRSLLDRSIPSIRAAMKEFDEELRCRFAPWYAMSYDHRGQIDLQPFQHLQKKIASLSAVLFLRVLMPEWRNEEHSLITSFGVVKGGSENVQITGICATESSSPFLRAAEEFVCLNYLAFIQNLIGRLRTLITGAAALFICAAISSSFYPFAPRPVLSYLFFAVFAGMASAVIVVYAQMHRDATLSHITNTTPGKLEGDFYVKVLEFVAGPALGLLAVIFPELTNFLFTWIQPGQMK